MYCDLRQLIDRPAPRGIFNWAKEVKNILYDCGFYAEWESQVIINVDVFLNNIHKRLVDIALQEMYTYFRNSSKYALYPLYKKDFSMTPYLLILKNIRLRNIIVRFRLSSHNLNIELGRHHAIPRHERICKVCNLGLIEDEHHFLLVCPYYKNLRATHLPTFYSQNCSFHHFNILMSSYDPTLIYAISIFLKLALEKRKLFFEYVDL